jgi:calcineurin-like phosphoesterase family protein
MEIGDAPQAEIKDAKATTEATADTEAKKSKISKSDENVNVSHSPREEEEEEEEEVRHEEEEEEDLADGVFDTQERYLLFMMDDFLQDYTHYPGNSSSHWRREINKHDIKRLNRILHTNFNCDEMADYIFRKIDKHPALMASANTMDGIFKVAYIIKEWKKRPKPRSQITNEDVERLSWFINSKKYFYNNKKK